MDNRAYIEGFQQKCAELGVGPRVLAKTAGLRNDVAARALQALLATKNFGRGAASGAVLPFGVGKPELADGVAKALGAGADDIGTAAFRAGSVAGSTVPGTAALAAGGNKIHDALQPEPEPTWYEALLRKLRGEE